MFEKQLPADSDVCCGDWPRVLGYPWFAGCNILLATNCSCRRGWIPQMLQKDSHDVFQHKLLTWLCEFLHDIDIIFKVFLKM
jgi:hypothetical protein